MAKVPSLDPSSTMKGVFLTSLPNEILQKILLLLPPIDIVICRSVCTRIRDNIDGSQEAQRLIKLALEGYQPSRHFNGPWTESIHDRFYQFRRRLLTFTPTSTVVYRLDPGGISYDDGLCAGDSTIGMMPAGYSTYTKLADIAPDPPHGIEILLRKHDYGYSPGTRLGYGFSAREGLMVITYLHKNDDAAQASSQGFTMEVQLKELSPTSRYDLETHPLATFDTLMVQLPPLPTVEFYKGTIKVCGDHIAIHLAVRNLIVGVLVIINWVSGAQIMVRDGVYDAKFLNSSQILIVFRPKDKEQAYLSIVYIRDTMDEYLYELPIFANRLLLMRLAVSPAAGYQAAAKGPFMRELPAWEVDCSLDVCTLEVQGGYDEYHYSPEFKFVVVIRVKSLQNRWGTTKRGGCETAWEEWGPTSTRWFRKQISQVGVSIYGSQILWRAPSAWLTSTGGLPEVDLNEWSAFTPLHTIILNFNPRGIHPSGLQSRQLNPRFIVRDAWTLEHKFFTHPVRGDLPFALFAREDVDSSVPVSYEGHYTVEADHALGLGALRVQSLLP